jgi:surfactin family lipopeptide synthetase C
MEALEDIYPLSPMQQGMLFHTIYAPGSGAYFEQSVFTVVGPLDIAAFERAWQRVVDRHAILRSSFLWEELETPHQVVHRGVVFRLDKQDWTTLTAADQEMRLADWIAADRDRGFDLAKPPLMRVALFRCANDLHRILFSRHHLLLDRWSRSLVLKEVFALYEAFSKGEDLMLPSLPPYGTYIDWLHRQDQEGAELYWRDELKDFTSPTVWASGENSAARNTAEPQYDETRIELSETSTERLRTFVREEKLTLNTVAQAAWALLLSRYSDGDDVVFGITVSGRPATLPGVESMVGLFINTLPLRVRVPAQTPVISWLKALQIQVSEMMQFEYCSLVDIQGWSEVPRGLPLFENIFVFENLLGVDTYQAPSSNVHFSEDRGFGSLTGYPLTILVTPAEKLTIKVIYARSWCEEQTVRQMLGHFRQILETLPESKTTAVARFSMLSKVEREQILVQWNSTATADSHSSIQQRFEAQVEAAPDTVALISNSEAMTYADLNRSANQLAHHLRSLGAGPDARVGICLERGRQLVIGVLATLKAGAASVPLDPEYPRDRLRHILESSECQILLTSETLLESLPETAITNLCLDRDWNRVASEPNHNPQNQSDAQNLAYVLYTSGSTGRPKGVAMCEGALSNLLSWQLDGGPFRPARTLQFASISFDVSFQEIFSTLCSGGTLLLISNELRRDTLSLLRFLNEQRVERIFAPAIFLQHLAATISNGAVLPEHMNEVITAGEQLVITPELRELFERLDNCVLINQYGPSETHVVTAYSLPATAGDWPPLPPIGRPIANTQIYVLDRNLEPVPIGVQGQLCIAGASLARGYQNQPSLTAERFVPNPFAGQPGDRLYLTGDLARYRVDGNIEFLGRVDDQVKIRGFRVELGEIETILMAHPSVRTAVVTAQEDVKNDRRLVGYLVPSNIVNETFLQEVRDWLRQQLPDHMIPSAFVVLESLPLTSSGKVNRRALPAPESPEVDADSYVAPRTSTEAQLAAIWCDVLNCKPVGIHDNFFELGGHSLLATQLISRVRNTFKVELPLRYLFASPTVAGFAAALEQFEGKVTTGEPSKITRNTGEEAAELLTKIDQMSEEELDALLKRAIAEGDSE